MTRSAARAIAEKITNDQLLAMLNRAKAEIKDWTVVSIVNKGLSKGIAWNILAKNFDVNTSHHIMAKTNMVREFGKYLPDELKPPKKEKIFYQHSHQDPQF
jgi:hypothetical protein